MKKKKKDNYEYLWMDFYDIFLGINYYIKSIRYNKDP